MRSFLMLPEPASSHIVTTTICSRSLRCERLAALLVRGSCIAQFCSQRDKRGRDSIRENGCESSCAWKSQGAVRVAVRTWDDYHGRTRTVRVSKDGRQCNFPDLYAIGGLP